MFNNISCEEFKKNIDNIVNNCGLPPVVAYYILKNSLYELEKICQNVIIYEKQNSTKEKYEQDIELQKEQDVLQEASQE